jgi:hypothetical protein
LGLLPVISAGQFVTIYINKYLIFLYFLFGDIFGKITTFLKLAPSLLRCLAAE